MGQGALQRYGDVVNDDALDKVANDIVQGLEVLNALDYHVRWQTKVWAVG